MRGAHLRRSSQFREPKPRSSSQDRLARLLFAAFADNVLPTFYRAIQLDAVAFARSVLDHDHSVRPSGQRRAGHNLYATSSGNGNGRRVASLEFAAAV